MTKTRTFTAIKLCLCVLTAATTLACGSAATKAPAAPSTTEYSNPVNAPVHELEVTFVAALEVVKATEERQYEAHRPSAYDGTAINTTRGALARK